MNQKTIEHTNVQSLKRCKLVYMLFDQISEFVKQLLGGHWDSVTPCSLVCLNRRRLVDRYDLNQSLTLTFLAASSTVRLTSFLLPAATLVITFPVAARQSY